MIYGGTTNIVNCYNMGEVNSTQTSSGNYNYASGIIGGSYNSGERKIINSCSLGKINAKMQNTQNFYYTWGGATVELENSYYLDTSINENTVINEDSIVFSKNDENIIQNLNKYVDEHKNDYEVELHKWKLNSEGLPVFE